MSRYRIMFTSVPEQVSRAVGVAAGAAVHAQDGGGVEGDDGVAGELAEEDEDRRDEDPRGGEEPAAAPRRSPRFGIASAVLALALKWMGTEGSRKCISDAHTFVYYKYLFDVLKHGNVFTVKLLQRSVCSEKRPVNEM